MHVIKQMVVQIGIYEKHRIGILYLYTKFIACCAILVVCYFQYYGTTTWFAIIAAEVLMYRL